MALVFLLFFFWVSSLVSTSSIGGRGTFLFCSSFPRILRFSTSIIDEGNSNGLEGLIQNNVKYTSLLHPVLFFRSHFQHSEEEGRTLLLLIS